MVVDYYNVQILMYNILFISVPAVDIAYGVSQKSEIFELKLLTFFS